MTTFHTLPVDEAITWIQAWTDHTWPITMGKAFFIRDDLGWIPSPDDGAFFSTKLSVNGKENGHIGRESQDEVSGVYFSLTSLLPFGEDRERVREVHSIFEKYVAALTELWGPGEKKIEEGIAEFRWVLANRVSVSIVGSDGLIDASIESPRLTQLYDEEAYYEEKGYGQEGLFD